MLRPGGTLALSSTRPTATRPAAAGGVWDTYRAAAIEKPPEQTVRTGLWKDFLPGPFEPLAESQFPNPVELDRAQILAQAASWSMIGALPDAERSALLARLAELLPERSTGIRSAPSSTARS